MEFWEGFTNAAGCKLEWWRGGRRDEMGAWSKEVYSPQPSSKEENLERKYEVKKNWKSRLIGNLPNPKNHPPLLPKQYFSKPKIIAGSSFPF